MLEVALLPARQGDAIWVRWGSEPRRQLIVDMGTLEIGREIRSRIEKLERTERRFELIVVSHVDRDHIGGVLTCLAKAQAIDGLEVADVWFNGWQHLHGRGVPPRRSARLEPWGPADGEDLARWLERNVWNVAFNGHPVIRAPNSLTRITLAGDLSITILGPTPERLQRLRKTWAEDVAAAIASGRLDERAGSTGELEAYGRRRRPPCPETIGDLHALADTPTGSDAAPANGSSIALLLEHGGRRVLLGADAYADDLCDALAALGEGRVYLDAFKVPHHGSESNVTDRLVRAVDCPLWLFSSDGTQFHHPDPVAIARVLRSAGKPRTLGFNVPSVDNACWNDARRREHFEYEVLYGDVMDGLTVPLPERV